MCRKCVCLMGFIVLLYFYHSYKDYNSINNQLLREIQRQNSELQEAFKSLQSQHLTAPSIEATSLEYLLSTKTLNHKSSSLNQTILKERIKEINNSIDISSQSSETKVITKSVKETKAADVKKPAKRTKATDGNSSFKRNKETDEKNLEKRKSVKKLSTSSWESTPLSAKENLNEYASPQTRYNLRSKRSTPAQSPNVSIMSPIQPKDLVDAVAKKLESKLPISSRV